MTGNASKSKPKVIPFDPQFREVQAVSTDILKEALLATFQQQNFQSALFQLLQPEFERISRQGANVEQLGSEAAREELLRRNVDQTSALNEQAGQLSQLAADAGANLGTLTPDERQLISQTIASARDIGQGQIDRFVAENFRNSNEVAAARGLRPSDAPLQNVRGRVAEEAISQKGQLESQLASQQAALSLDLPLQRAAALGQLSASQGGLAQAGTQFQAALQQNAAANRLNLVQSTGQLGLGLTGLASTGPGLAEASRPVVGQKTSSGGGGISTMHAKTNGHSVDRAEVLRRLQALPIQAWQYLWENGTDAFRIGPYAEDFQQAFGGESYQIDFLHALGVAMVALQEMAGRLERLEEKVGILFREGDPN